MALKNYIQVIYGPLHYVYSFVLNFEYFTFEESLDFGVSSTSLLICNDDCSLGGIGLSLAYTVTDVGQRP